MSSINKYINHQDSHLSEEQMMRYQKGRMSPAEMREVELHLLNCEMCSDAMEGFELISSEEFTSDMKDIKSMLQESLGVEKPQRKHFYLHFAAAASVLLLIVSSIVFFISRGLDVELENKISLSVPEQQEETESLLINEDSLISKAEENSQSLAVNYSSEKQAASLKKSDNVVVSKPQTGAEPIKQKKAIKEEDTIVMKRNFSEEDSDVPHAALAVQSPNKNDNAQEITMEKSSLPSRNVGQFADKASSAPVATYNKKEEISTTPSYGEKIVRGKITSAEDGGPLPGVNVYIKGSNKGVISDIDGGFQLSIPNNSSLVFSFIGMETKEIEVGTRSVLDIQLNSDVKALSEVVVTNVGSRYDGTNEAAAITEPKPQGGYSKYNKYLKENSIYPKEAIDNNIEGKVSLEFYVNPDGSIDSITVTKGLGFGLDEEAARLVKEGPSWQPGKRNETAFRQKVTLKIPFKLKNK
jgi:TonB family protein